MVRPCGCADHRQQGWLMQNNRGSSKAKTQIRTFVGSPTDGPATCIPRRPGMIPRTLFSAEHEAFRTQVRRFMTEEVTPNRERWEAQQHVDRSIWTRAGELGFLCTAIPEQYGGMGGDRLHSTILIEEAAHAADSSLGFTLHSDIVASYLLNFGTEAQKHHWLPKLASGETIGAIAMTEPGTGSDLQAVKTTAVTDGDDYVLDG